ncbi:MAG: UMP kinase [Nitrosopumilus sp.]|nr:UMP kinase [Nitrosopumilus sp.]
MKRVVIKLSGRAFAEDGPGLARYAAALRGIRSRQPVVVAGGGRIARHYIEQARAAGADEATLDEIGIDVSRLNARLLIHVLGTRAYPYPPATLREALEAADTGRIVVAGGLHPGQSTNGTAALIAEKVGASLFVNATDVDGVYDRDPNRFKGARRLRSIGVADLRKKLASEETIAGGYDLMDIVALKTIERSRMPTRIIKSTPSNVARAAGGAALGTAVIPGR